MTEIDLLVCGGLIVTMDPRQPVLVDGSVAVDAGAITRALTIPEQRRIRHVLVTHTHMDHTATLPFLIENIFGANSEPVTIYCTKRVLAGVRRHLFNNDTWPDFSRIPNQLYPSVRFEVIEPEPRRDCSTARSAILIS